MWKWKMSHVLFCWDSCLRNEWWQYLEELQLANYYNVEGLYRAENSARAKVIVMTSSNVTSDSCMSAIQLFVDVENMSLKIHRHIWPNGPRIKRNLWEFKNLSYHSASYLPRWPTVLVFPGQSRFGTLCPEIPNFVFGTSKCPGLAPDVPGGTELNPIINCIVSFGHFW